MKEEKLRFIYENIQDVVWAIDVKTRRFSFISPSVLALRGYTPEEAMEQRIEDTLTPESKIKIYGVLDNTINEFKTNGKSRIYIDELEQYCKDGSTVWIEVVAKLVTDEHGETTELIGVSRNISQWKKNQMALAESEKRFRELADLLPQTIYELDNEGKIIFSNKTGIELFGLSHANKDSLGYAYDYFTEDSIAPMRENRDLIKQGIATVKEFKAVKADGSVVPVLIYGAPIVKEGKVVGSRGIIVDISERKSMEEALRKSEERYKKLIGNLQEGLFVIQQGKFTFLNEAIVSIVGYSVDELIGRNFLDAIAPECKEQVKINHINRMQGKQSPESYETLLLYKDQVTRIPVIISVTVSDFNGEPAVIGTAKDITYIKKNEEALRKRESRLTAIFDSALIGIGVLDPEKKFVNCNAKILEMLGYQQDDFKTIHYDNIIYPGDKAKSLEKYTQLCEGKITGYQEEYRFVRKDGSIFWGSLSVTCIRNLNNEIEALVLIIFDLTERKIMEDNLRKAQEKLKKELEKESIRSQFETLKNQVNPHFLFNSLNVLSSLIHIEPDLAEKFTEQLAKVYRYVLENKDKDVVTLKTELDFLTAYKFLLEIRFKNKLQINLSINETKFDAYVPTLAMQLLIENAIKHNVLSKQMPLIIDIYIDELNELVISNNLQAREKNIQSTGVGLKNIAKRYSYLTNKPTFFGITGDKYTARIPLL